jgi:hypothetical protein
MSPENEIKTSKDTYVTICFGDQYSVAEFIDDSPDFLDQIKASLTMNSSEDEVESIERFKALSFVENQLFNTGSVGNETHQIDGISRTKKRRLLINNQSYQD